MTQVLITHASKYGSVEEVARYRRGDLARRGSSMRCRRRA